MNFFIPPYAEKRYGDPNGFFNGIKVMAIGNSHYCTEGYDKDNRCGLNCRNYMIPGLCGNVNGCYGRTNCFTQDVMEDYIANPVANKKEKTNWKRTFTSFAHIFNGSCDVKEVWKSLCFYNFLDVAVQDNKAQGTVDEISDAKNKVIEAIILNSPDVIIVWGEPNVFCHMLDVFNHFPENMSWQKSLNNDLCGILTLDNKEIKVVCIKHPSRGGHDEARSIIKSIAPEIIKE